LWDLEFLNDVHGRRVAAFGQSAGAVGMALGFWTWAGQILGAQPVLPSFTTPYKDWEALAEAVKAQLDKCALPWKPNRIVQLTLLLIPEPLQRQERRPK